jgi:hypothetical protein
MHQNRLDGMRHDPEAIGEYLVKELGFEEAKLHVFEQVMTTRSDGDLYALSVWREVKRFLARNPEHLSIDRRRM